jgi:hypothetical protein
MPIIATPSRRRTAMAVMLALAMTGLVVRYFAPNPSTLRDFGTLLMVMWLPAVGNFAAWLIGKIPRPPPRVMEFTPGAAFVPHLLVRLEATPLPPGKLASFHLTDDRCTVVMGKQGYLARLDQPMVQALATAGGAAARLELLHPHVALAQLPAGTRFHLLFDGKPVAQGEVEQVLAG